MTDGNELSRLPITQIFTPASLRGSDLSVPFWGAKRTNHRPDLAADGIRIDVIRAQGLHLFRNLQLVNKSFTGTEPCRAVGGGRLLLAG